jgi:hypothetical protein
VTTLSDDNSPFEFLKTSEALKIPNFENGIYIAFNKNTRDDFSKVDLIYSDPDASDFFLPNGQFNQNKFELISYLSETRVDGDSSLYLSPASDLPPSETRMASSLEPQGNCFGVPR